MSRRPGNLTRRLGGGGVSGLFHQKTNTSPLITTILIFLCGVFVIAFLMRTSGRGINTTTMIEGDYTCTLEVPKAIPLLRQTYGDSMRKILHVGPESCLVVSEFLKEEGIETWGIEPYGIDDVGPSCNRLVRKGFVRVTNIKYPLPYKERSFSIVIISDSLDYLPIGHLNQTLPQLARAASDAVVVFTGIPGQSRAKAAQVSKFGRPAKMRSQEWWQDFFVQMNLEENESAVKTFKQAATENSYTPGCQIFHLKSYD